MIVSWNWLNEYVPIDQPVAEIENRLRLAGLNHESTSDVDGDIAIDLEVTSNRPDCLGHLGIAREIAVLTDHSLRLPPTDFVEDPSPTSEVITVLGDASARDWCPYYRARVIEGVKVGASPDWLRRRLKTVGLPSINNVVDITNYVLMECGQPLHAFDLDKLEGSRIVVRSAHPNETFVAINNKSYELNPSMGVIADGRRAVALAGIMGGLETEVSIDTKRVLLESALFLPLPIRRTSRALDLSSDSSYRFERKVDPAGVLWASDRACHLLAKLAGGRVTRGAVDLGAPSLERSPIALRWSKIPRTLGVDIPRERAKKIITQLGMAIVEEGEDHIVVRPPSSRRDVEREIDLVEEIGRIHGYDSVPEDRVIPMVLSRQRTIDRLSEIACQTLCACGYFEAVTFSFSDSSSLAMVRPWSSAAPLTVRHGSRKQENALRQSLLPSLLRVLSLNEARGNADPMVFELAHLYLPKTGAELPDEPLALGIASTRPLREVRGHVEAALSRMGVPVRFQPVEVPGLLADQAGHYLVGDEVVGVLGVAPPALSSKLDLRQDAVVAELLVSRLVPHARLTVTAQPIPDRPSVVRDFAIVLDESVRWSELEAVARSAAGPFLESLKFVDLYRGKQVPEGKKSIAFRLTYRASDRTLTREEVDGYQQSVLTAITARLAGVLRE